jgi:HPt (histidine-containing phosphotransfer) domain-containing protein
MALLDTTQLAALYDLAGPDTGEMLELFSETAREGLEDLVGHLAAGEDERMLELVHQIKGGAATMGLAAFEKKVAACEARLRAGSAVDPLEIGSLRPLLDESVRAVQEILDGPEAQKGPGVETGAFSTTMR